jgi:hypothetical protein
VSAVALGLLWVGVALALVQVLDGWKFAAVGVAFVLVAVGLSRLVLPVATGQVRPEVTMWLVVGFGCLVVALVSGLDHARRRLAAQSFGVAQALSASVAVVGALLVLASFGWYVVGGLGGPLHRQQADSLPKYILDTESGPSQSRTLVVSLSDGGVRWVLHQADHIVWGDGETGLPPSQPEVRSAVEGVVAQISAARQDDDVATQLQALGVVHIQVRGITPEVSAALAASPGIARGGEGNGVTVFTVVGHPARVMLATADGMKAVPGSIETSTTGTLILSEATDPRWRVSVGGVALERTTSPDWRPAFVVDGQTGDVTVTLAQDRWSVWMALAQLLALILLALFAAPAVSRESDDYRAGRRSLGGAA